MHYRNFHRPPLTGQPFTAGPTAQPIFLHTPYNELRGEGQASPPLQIAVPAPG